VLTTEQRTEIAEVLRTAEEKREPVPPLVDTYPGLDADDAYEIQLVNIRRRVQDTATPVVGHKVGLSSKAMQQMMGVGEPDYGHLLEDMRLEERTPVRASRYCYPRVEVEVGFVLGEDLPGAGCTEQEVVDATAAVVPSIELIDSRIRDWKIGLPDTIADNASSAGFCLGQSRLAPDEVDLKAIGAVLVRNGEQVAEGRSDAVLGDPVIAVAWLARKVADFGVRLRAGNVILPGSCTRAVDARPGDEFKATFSHAGAVLGDVSLTFE
jgi:2-keto-4-pentenoate hydratase